MATDADWVAEVRRWLRTSGQPAVRRETSLPTTEAQASPAVEQQQGETPEDAPASDRTPT